MALALHRAFAGHHVGEPGPPIVPGSAKTTALALPGVWSVRSNLFAWVVGLLVLGSGGWMAAQSAAETTTLTGQLSASEQEADEGYFALGQDTMLVVKPDSPLHHWLRTRSGQQVRVTIEVDRGTR